MKKPAVTTVTIIITTITPFAILLLPFIATIFSPHTFSFRAYAQNMTSGSGYEIIDPTINAGGNDDQSSTGGYMLMESIGDSFNDERFESSNYKLGVGHGYTFTANVPEISYFQTDDAAMVNICGTGGCYNRARFEIDANDNPTDTLYLIEITDDNWTTIYCLDGSTHQPKAIASKTINDYITKSSWETGSWTEANILGLSQDTQYKIRAKALHGDFTESEAGPEQTEDTTDPYISFDINISGDTWQSSTAPYEISIGEISTTGPSTASNLIWLDIDTNAVNGATISVRDENQSLLSAATGGHIDSESEDLASEDEGYGLKIDTSKRLPASGQPGFVRESTTYNTAGAHEVGALASGPTVILCTIEETGGNCSTGVGSPVDGGRAAIWIKVRASVTNPAAGDYADSITFTSVGTF